MPLKYLIDEHLRGRFTQSLVERGHAEGCPVNVVETGGMEAPPLGTKDPQLLRWAEARDRLIISLDRNSLPAHLEHHLAAGFTSPGILFIRRQCPWDEILHSLLLLAAAGDPEDYRDRCTYIPF